MTIAHVTILNPINHTRILKLANTQADLGYTIHIIGKKTPQASPLNPNFTYHLTGNISRKILHRLLTHLQILLWWIKQHPQIHLFWIHTPELFWLFLLNKIFGKKQVYDVHEDYFQNLYHASYYSRYLRKPMAYVVRWIEKQIAKCSYVVYAEHCYENLLNAPSYEVIVNNFDFRLLDNIMLEEPTDYRFVISGNLSEEWGVMEAIDFWETQNQFYPAQLTIIGYAPLPSFAQKIHQRIQNSPFQSRCTLIGIETYVPYHTVLQAIAKSNLVLAPYRPSPIFSRKIPTKFYEAFAMNKTILFTKQDYWVKLNEQYHFGYAIENWKSPWAPQILPAHSVPKSFYDWSYQKPKIERILNAMSPK